MTDDVFSDWKENKFIVVNKDLIDEEDGIMILLTDVGYWVDRTDELIEWCKQNNCIQRGMTVTMSSNEELLMFCLKWA